MPVKRIKILVIEDDAGHSELIKRGFDDRAEFCECIFVDNISKAVDFIENMNPDIIISDWKLPDGDGIELIKRYKNYNFPIVLMTSFGNELFAVESIKLGAIDYVVKSPDTLSDMYKVVVKAIKEYDNIVKRREAEEALRESESKYRTLVDTSPDGIAIYDIDGKIIGCNNVNAQMLGYEKPEDLTGKFVIELIDQVDREKAFINLNKTLDEGLVRNVEYCFIKKDSSKFFGESSSSLVRDANGNPKYLVSITRDISDRKKSDVERLRLQNLESLGLLAGGIAHDFNNILSTILGRVSLAMINLDEGKLKNNLIGITKATKRAIGLTQQLLTFSKGGCPEKSVIDIKKVIHDTAKFSLSGSNVEVEFNFGDTFTLVADQGHISQVIQNLVINAKQAMPLGGKIYISTEDVFEAHDKMFVKIVVRDNGIGIPKEYVEKIFDPYFSTKQDGSGLGLAVCYSIILRHDGTISVESQPGKGTAFTIILPAAENQMIEGEETTESVSKHMNVLIMDDEQDIRDTLAELLASLGHEVTTSKDGAEALNLYENAKRDSKPFDLIFMDLTIKGGMGGLETIKRLREMEQTVKVIVSSGYSDESMSNYKKYGFDGKLNKPYTIEDLNSAISMIFTDH
jgi:two-component system, cell cycle sensor histidine kinase and response regulator CckA